MFASNNPWHEGFRGTEWDIFLACLPVLFAYGAVAFDWSRWNRRREGIGPASWIFLCLWLAFLPNAPYLLTEWRHLFIGLEVDCWPLIALRNPVYYGYIAFWTLLMGCYTGSGVLAMTLAIRPIIRLGDRHGWSFRVWGPPVFWLQALSVYLGLVVRLNSWDLVRHPWAVARPVLHVLFHRELLVSVFVTAVLFWLFYEATGMLLDGLGERLRKLRPGRGFQTHKTGPEPNGSSPVRYMLGRNSAD